MHDIKGQGKNMKVLLVDDHIPMRKQVKSLIGQENDLDVVADVGSAETALALVRQLRPDVVVMDIMLPRMNGIDATWAIMAECPGTRIIAFSNYSAPILIQAVLEAGALGFVCKPRALEELIPAIRSVGVGRQYVTGRPSDQIGPAEDRGKRRTISGCP